MAINSSMKLEWTFDIPKNRLSFSLDNNIHYVAHGGGKEGISKISIGKNEVLIDYDDWPEELRWISDNYSDVYAELEIPPELKDVSEIESFSKLACFKNIFGPFAKVNSITPVLGYFLFLIIFEPLRSSSMIIVFLSSNP